MIPSFKHGIIASSMPKAAAGGGGDVTPNAVDWDDFNDLCLPNNSTVSGTMSGAKTISGINTSINLYYECSYCGDGGNVYYKKNGGAWTQVAEFENISVSNGDTLDWGYGVGLLPGSSISIIIKNASDSNAIIDNQINFQYIYSPFCVP